MVLFTIASTERSKASYQVISKSFIPVSFTTHPLSKTMLMTIKELDGAFEPVTKAFIVELTAKIGPARCSIIFPSLLDSNKRSIYT